MPRQACRDRLRRGRLPLHVATPIRGAYLLTDAGEKLADAYEEAIAKHPHRDWLADIAKLHVSDEEVAKMGGMLDLRSPSPNRESATRRSSGRIATSACSSRVCSSNLIGVCIGASLLAKTGWCGEVLQLTLCTLVVVPMTALLHKPQMRLAWRDILLKRAMVGCLYAAETGASSVMSRS